MNQRYNIEKISVGGLAGNLQKWIVKRGNNIYYVKDRSQADAFEPETEVFGYKLASLLGVEAIPQWLENIDNLSHQPVSVSKDYKEGRMAMSLFRYMRANVKGFSLTLGESRYNLVMSVLPKEAQLLHDTILYFDYIITNPDRHLRNFDVFCDREGKITAMVPAYDFGMAMYSNRATFEGNLRTNPYFRREQDQIGFLIKRNKQHTMKPIIEEHVQSLASEMYPANRSDILSKKVISRLKELDLLC